MNQPHIYTRLSGPLTPNIRRWMAARGWLDHRIVSRLDRTPPTPEEAALAYRLRILEAAPGSAVDVKA